MVAFAALLLALQPAAATGPELYRDAVDLFMRVCTQGGGGFARGTIETIAAVDVASVRNAVGQQRHNRFYRVSPGGWQAFLILQDTLAEGDSRNRRHCTVATRSVDFSDAVRRIFPGRKPVEGGADALYMHQSPQGHRVNVRQLRGGYVSMTAIVPGPDAIRDEDVVAAFRDACDRSSRRYAVAAKGAALGWEEVVGSAHPSLDRLLAVAAGEGEGRGARAFRRVIADRPVFALVTEAAGGSAGTGTTCRLYDFGAGAPIDAGLVERWFRPVPARRAARQAGGPERLLRPDWDKNIAIEFLHVPANGALALQHGFSGNLLGARAIGDP